MARKIVQLNEPDRPEAAQAVIDQMFAYFDAMESRFPTEGGLPQAA